MPLELQIIRASEFIRVGAHGHFDLPASKAALAELAGACRKRGISQALMDLRALQPGPTPVFSSADLLELVGTFRDAGFTHRDRLAILYRTDPYHRARLFAFLSTLRGWKVQSFDDFEKAVTWLSQTKLQPVTAVKSATAKQVPIRHLSRDIHAVSPPKPRRSQQARPASADRRSR